MNNQEVKSTEEQAADAMDAQQAPATPPAVQAEVVEPPQTAPAEQRVASRPNTDIAVQDGLLQPTTLTEATRIARGLLESGCIPRQYDSVPKVLMGMQFLRQLGLPDIACLPKLAIVNGSYSLWGEGPKAVCQPEIEDFEEFWFDKDYKEISFKNKNLDAELFGAICRVKRKQIPTWTERTFTVKEAKDAGLWNGKDTWKKYPKRMLQMRTRSWALKDAFPDKLMGVGIAEYDHDVIIEGNGDLPVNAGNQAAARVEKFVNTHESAQ
jgi:hypothetical protein